jgi:hypothetical protein
MLIYKQPYMNELLANTEVAALTIHASAMHVSCSRSQSTANLPPWQRTQIVNLPPHTGTKHIAPVVCVHAMLRSLLVTLFHDSARAIVVRDMWNAGDSRAAVAAASLSMTTIDQFYASRHCIVCDDMTPAKRPICQSCAHAPQLTTAVLMVCLHSLPAYL